VRVAHLLEHSSGLLDITREEFDHNEPFPTLEAAFAYRPQVRVVQWSPGLHSVYSNANAGFAGLIIERKSGQDYECFIAKRLLEPLGMHSASLSDDETMRKRLATGYDTDGATLAARHGLTYGYGLGLGQSLRKGFLWYGHGGDGDGYLSHFAYNREADAGYFLTINAFNQSALDAMKAQVQDHLPHALSPPRPPPPKVDPDTLSLLTGTYVAVTRRFEWQNRAHLGEDRLQIVLEDGALYTRSSSGRRRLIPVDEHLFHRQDQTLATIAIVPHDGDLYLQASFGNYRRVER